MLRSIWNYILYHKWAKDIFRANLLFFLLIILYNIFKFHLKGTGIGLVIKWAFLMNFCLVVNTIVNYYGGRIRRR